jgi:hypothetical protein
MTNVFRLCAKTGRDPAAMPVATALAIAARRVSLCDDCRFDDMANHLSIPPWTDINPNCHFIG